MDFNPGVIEGKPRGAFADIVRLSGGKEESLDLIYMAATHRSPPSQQLRRRVPDRVLKLPDRSLEGAYTNYRRYLPYKEADRLSKGRAPVS